MASDRSLSRRDFVRAGAAGAALLLGNAPPLKAEGAAKLPQRVLGKTGQRLCPVGRIHPGREDFGLRERRHDGQAVGRGRREGKANVLLRHEYCSPERLSGGKG